MFPFTFVNTVTNGNVNYNVSIFFMAYKRQLCLFKKMSEQDINNVTKSKRQAYKVETKLTG